MKPAQMILLVPLVAFFVYAIVTQPDKAVDIFQIFWDIAVAAFQAIGDFFDSILNRN